MGSVAGAWRPAGIAGAGSRADYPGTARDW